MSKAIGALADELNQALNEAAEVFCARFTAPASVPLESGGELWFMKHGRAYELVYVDTEQQLAARLVTVALMKRKEAAYKLEELWDACLFAEKRLFEDLDQAVEKACAFVRARKDADAR